RKFPLKFHPFGGAQFWSLHYKHALLITQFLKQNPSFLRFFKYVFVPDEILIQTLAGNIIDNNELVNRTLHFLEWDRPGAVLIKTDMDSIKITEHLYARKFDRSIDAEVINIIDAELLYR
ncbi:MAG TPA: beta-1,6-N-acetylglucosaminyltransferase, partial [Pedobacter sp.]